MTFSNFLYAIVILQYATAFASPGSPRVDPLVNTKVGLIAGEKAPDGDYSMFLGIPYAKVQEGNPFGPSVPYPPFEGTFEANDDLSICPQREDRNNTIFGTIDCLHLSVYAPTEANSRNRLPVLVWIHGGGFNSGYSARYLYGPKFLVRHGVILVALNYRLGPYGFMCVDTPTVSGNQGLKDQYLALKWIKENIEAFGGDANQITVFGESAGGASVDYHVHLEKEKLFQKVILQSGTILGSSQKSRPNNELAFKLAEYLGLITNDVNDALSFLSGVDTTLVIAAVHELGLSFPVCIENTYDGVEPFLTEHPINLVPTVKNIPLLVGFNNDEGLLTHGNTDAEVLKNMDIVGDIIRNNFDFDSQSFDEMSEIVRHFYFSDDEGTKRQVIDLTSDFAQSHSAHRTLRKYFNSGTDNIFFYVFSYSGTRNYVKYMNNITFEGGAAHADELSYLFDVSYMTHIMSDQEQVVVDRMTTLWTNFAKYGDPTPETTDLLPIKWVPATKDRLNYLNIDSTLTMDTRPFNERMTFMDLFYKMNEKSQKGFVEKNDS